MITRGTLLVCTVVTSLILGAGYWLGTVPNRPPNPTPPEHLAEPATEPPAPVDAPTPDQQATAAPAPAAAEVRQLDIIMTPHGFIKAALAGSPTAVSRMQGNRKTTIVS